MGEACWGGAECQLIRLKFRLERASRHAAFMLLVLIKSVKRGAESKISFCYPRDLRASPQIYRKRGGVI